jgi:hypothetical protein
MRKTSPNEAQALHWEIGALLKKTTTNREAELPQFIEDAVLNAVDQHEAENSIRRRPKRGD